MAEKKTQTPLENVRSKLDEFVETKSPAAAPGAPVQLRTATTDFVELQVKDYSWKVNSRKTIGWVLVGLLLVQNFVVFAIVIAAMLAGKLVELQLIFAVLVTATLGETAYMVKVIVEWLFREINYPLSGK